MATVTETTKETTALALLINCQLGRNFLTKITTDSIDDNLKAVLLEQLQCKSKQGRKRAWPLQTNSNKRQKLPSTLLIKRKTASSEPENSTTKKVKPATTF